MDDDGPFDFDRNYAYDDITTRKRTIMIVIDKVSVLSVQPMYGWNSSR